MSGLIVPKRKSIVQESDRGVCLWEMPSGGYLSDGEGYLSMEGDIRNPIIEKKMKEAARSYLGHDYGQPKWFPGYRKVTNDEYDDQMERLLDGRVPDIQDAERQRGN